MPFLTIIFSAFRWIGSVVAKLVELAITHWRIVLPLLLIALMAWHYVGIRKERDAAVQALVEYKAEVLEAKRQRAIENMALEQATAIVMEQEKAKHAVQIEKLRRSYNAIRKDKTAADITAATLRSELRRELEKATAATGLSGHSGGLVRPAKIGGDSNTTNTGHDAERYIDTLEHACAITTSDYNTLYDRVETVNRIYGK
jgi:hypothetical protein